MIALSKHRSYLWLVAAILILSTFACETITGPSPTDTLPEPIPSATFEPTEVPAEPATSTPLPTESPAPILETETGLSPDGPWWIISAEEGIYAVNADGSGMTQFIGQEIFPTYDSFVDAPSGGRLAFTAWDPNTDQETLYILELPAGEIKEVTSLSSGVGPIYQGDPLFEARQYIASGSNLAWSPDGMHLAFTGFIDGPTLDLYAYSVQDGVLTRLTDGFTAALWPSWASNGTDIYFFGVPGLLTGEGPVAENVWAVAIGGVGGYKLYQASVEDYDTFVGWLDADTLLTQSGIVPSNLRTINLPTGDVTTVWENDFNHFDFDPVSRTFLLGVRSFTAEDNPDLQQGLYIADAWGNPPFRFLQDDPLDILWSEEAGLFFAETEFGIVAVSSVGEFIDLDVPASASGFPIVAPETRELAWRGQNLWVSKLTSGLDDPPRMIHPVSVYYASWGPKGQHLLFVSGLEFYVTQSPDFVPTLVEEKISFNSAVWVWP
ncbi:MAG: hypothetical protein GTO18_22195 [Anaerolineales bacterium]|nr:hypothetical protein [Anaerolineales bacterium]